MPKIFAVNFSGRDYSNAEKYGEEIIYMTRGVLDLRKHSTYKKMICKYLTQATTEDYLLFSGPTLIQAIALSEWLRNIGKCNVLIWIYNMKKPEDSFYEHYTVEA